MKNLLLAAALMLPAAALAAPRGVALTHNGALTEFHGVPGQHGMTKWSPPKGAKTIFDTLGSPVSYDDGYGWTISNAASETGATQWFAYAVVPKKDATVTEIDEAVSYVAGGDFVTVALLADDNGSPGKVMQEKVVKTLETFGDCCGVAVDKISGGIKVTAGTTYWVAAILPKKKESTTWDAWCFSTENTNSGTAAYYNGTWNVTSDPYTAFAVFGQ